MTDTAAALTSGAPTLAASAISVPKPATVLDAALTARIAATKRRLLEGGLLQEVEWGKPTGERDIRRAAGDRMDAAGRAD